MKNMFPQVLAWTRVGYGNYSSSVSIVVPTLTSAGKVLYISQLKYCHFRINCGSWM